MARNKAKAGAAQKRTGYVILLVLGLITVGLLVQQSRFNPAVTVASRSPQLAGGGQAAARQAPKATAAFLPEVPGFTPLASVESFGPENLSDKIDGKAELYLPAGFKEMSCRRFEMGAAGKAHVEVYLYDMGAPANAFAVFSGQRRPGAPSLPLTAKAYATANALFFTQGRFYVEMVADQASEALKNPMKTYAKALLAKLPGGGKAKEEAADLPKEGLALDTVRLCAADSFGCEGLNKVLTGEYTLKSGKATGFMGRRATPEEARAEAKRYLEFLTANGYQKVAAPGIAGDAQVLVLEGSYEVVFALGRTFAGVHDATSQAAALELAGRLAAALKGKP
jgi:hypothetical protein